MSGSVRLACWALAALLGNVALQQLEALPGRPVLAALGLGALALVAVRRTRLIGIGLAFFCLSGFTAAERLADRLASEPGQLEVELAGWVDDFPRQDGRRAVFTLRVARPDGGPPGAAHLPRRVRLTWYEAPIRIEPAMSLTLTVRLRPPRGLVNPGGFDYERWLLTEGIGATGYVREGHVERTGTHGIGQALLELRARLAEALAANVAEGPGRSLLTALALGVRTGFTDDEWTVLRRTGTAHLVAISGLHIGLVAAFAFQGLLRMLLRVGGSLARHAWPVAAVATLLPATAYAALAGFALPTVRALLMLAVAEAVILSRRRVAPVTGLSLAALAVLVCDPLATLGASFWLSFGAVAAIVASVRRPAGEGTARGGVLAGLLALVRIQFVVGIALLPLTALNFAEVSLAAFPVNLLAVPFFSFVLVPFSLLAVVALAAGAGGLATVAAAMAGAVWAVLATVAGLPGAAVSVPEPSLPGLAIGAAGVVGFLCLRSWHRWLTLIGLAGILLKFPDRPAPGAFDLAVLDVGHGLAIIVRTATRSLVYDAGPVTRNGFDAGHEIVVPALGRLSAHRLDLIVVSHGDSDHAGGLPALRDAYPATPLIAGPDVAVDGATVCAAGDRWRWDGVDFRVLHPASGFSRRGNDSSCVLLITAGTNRVLLTGDIERDAERELVTAGVPRTAVVLAPHHGSSTSSSAALVDATRPTHVIASAAFRNRWNFPRPDVVERWQSAGGRMHSTGESGAVSIRVSAAGVRVESLRETRRRYWAADSGTGPGSAL